MPEPSKLSLTTKLLLPSISVFLVLVGAEIALRLQSRFDLEDDVTRGSLLQTLNHLPDKGTKTFILESKSVFGDSAGVEYEQAYDKDGIQITKLRPTRDDARTAVLFMGDSFVQGYDEANTIPHHVFQFISNRHPEFANRAFLNAGYSSYSPAIFIPQARALLPKLHPQFVVVVIDETDMGDDFFRYRKLTTRRKNERIDGVRPSPPLRVAEWMRSQPLYLIRMIGKLWDGRVPFPRLEAAYRNTFYAQLEDDLPPLPLPVCDEFTGRVVLAPLRYEEAVARRKFANAIAYFEQTLTDLALTLIEGGVPANRILFVSHPYLWHLIPGPEGRTWNRLSAETIGKVAARYQISFYDAQSDLAAAFAPDPSRFYWKQDIHFNFLGLKIYSELIAQKLEILLFASPSQASAVPAGGQFAATIHGQNERDPPD